jgi:hypothetical protein
MLDNNKAVAQHDLSLRVGVVNEGIAPFAANAV